MRRLLWIILNYCTAKEINHASVPERTDDVEKLTRFDKILIIPCRFCPAVSKNEPYFEFHRHCLKTAAYDGYIETLKAELEAKGVKADVFKSRWLHPFVVCMWTGKRRTKLRKCAEKYDALVVLGCEAAVQTIIDSLDTFSIPVIQGMRTEGIMSILSRFQWPGNITLKLNSITPLLQDANGGEPWAQL